MEAATTYGEPLFSVVWRLTKHKSGTFYIHIPKEFASLQGFQDGDQVELKVLRVMRKREEKKK